MSSRVMRALAGCAILSLAGLAPLGTFAQTLVEQNAAIGINDTLNAQSVGPSPSAGYIDRAQTAAGQAQGLQTPPPPGANPQFQNLNQNVQQGVQNVAAKIATIQVIAGDRVFDNITGELIDDATEQQVPATERGNYFDDGTNGDIEANDGQYTKVTERRDVIGQSNQRIKERLVQALLAAESLNPLEFYGFNLMSTEREESVSRGRAWALQKDPKGGPGRVLAEVPISEPVTVPKYRKWQSEKDQKVKSEWAERFLREYRINKDSLTSDFYQLYVPQPPPQPLVDAPAETAWIPFAEPLALQKANEFSPGGAGFGGPGQGGLGGAPGGGVSAGDRAGVTGQPVGNASSRYF